MMDACHLLIAGIKTMWARMYQDSKIRIAEWPIEVIDSPKQNNGYVFFAL
jgi:hypothetical protein